jgi:formylglycine-generating enzyme required for sulfatase activity
MRDYYTRYPRPILWLIPTGSVTMESVGGEPVEAAVEPFYLSKLPVTNEQYEAFDPDHERDDRWPGDRDPVTRVSWEDAHAYCRWYAEIARKPIRLPSDAEWEHACRAGARRRFFFDDESEADEYVLDREATGGRLVPLEETRPNPHGLHGMLGGVWEWVASEPGPSGSRPLRGGSFLTPRDEIGCGARRMAPVDLRAADVGFRIAKSLRTP